jgi:hypothetical protein
VEEEVGVVARLGIHGIGRGDGLVAALAQFLSSGLELGDGFAEQRERIAPRGGIGAPDQAIDALINGSEFFGEHITQVHHHLPGFSRRRTVRRDEEEGMPRNIPASG